MRVGRGVVRRRRALYAGLTLAAVGAGLLVHLHGTALSPTARDITGDALWAMMIYWLTGIVAPGSPIAVRAAAAIGVCTAVELSQMIDAPWLERIRGTRIGHLMLGSDFDARDLLAYAAGVAVAAIGERIVGRGW